jgi:hypothetical protein
MEPTRLLAILALIGLLGVEYGGWALLTFITGRDGLSDGQLRWFRAGHAHAGTLLVLSLVYFRYLSDTSLSMTLRWTGGALMLVGILAQAGGFFVHMASGARTASSAGTRVTRSGGLLLGSALLLLTIGLATA